MAGAAAMCLLATRIERDLAQPANHVGGSQVAEMKALPNSYRLALDGKGLAA